jgi:hypothetical protein
MWSKGAQKDYLDTYDEYEEDYDEYEEVETVKVEEKVQENPKEIEIKSAIEIKVESTPVFQSENDSDYEEEYSRNCKINKTLYLKGKNQIDSDVYIDELMFSNYEVLSVGNKELYKRYREQNSVPSMIKRFGFKKLKSNDKNTYYLDKTLYFIWKYVNNYGTNEAQLVRVDDAIYKNLKNLNGDTIIYDRFLSQPEMCY